MAAELQEIDLADFERKVHSQNGEDGVLEKIFELVGTTNKFFVEFGVEDGSECNTKYLREAHGWSGLMMDGSHSNPSINLQQEFITAENINELFLRYNVPKSFDLLSIDIDFNDFYVWKQISGYRPRVVVIEYNATHLPGEDRVVRYDATAKWDGSNYFGASFLSLRRLGLSKEYSLVYAESHGVNLFFIADEVLQSVAESQRTTFKGVSNPDSLYRPPNYPKPFGGGPNNGHPADPKGRQYSSADALLC